jgi:hypothetical protein
VLQDLSYETCLLLYYYLTSSCVVWSFFDMSGAVKGPRVPKKAQITQERVEYNVFLFDEPRGLQIAENL